MAASTYLLDTNACIAIINDSPASARLHFADGVARKAAIVVPTVAAFELWYGFEKSTRKESNRIGLEQFLSTPINLLPFDEEDARIAGSIRAALEKSGKPIGAYDVLIGAQALRHRFTLVTANHREFGRIEGLKWEDWGKP